MNVRMLELTPKEEHLVLDQGRIESACCKPAQHLYFAQTDDIFTLAAVFGEALVTLHCFLNGNKRTAAGCVFDFLMLNGWELTAPEHEIVPMYEGIVLRTYSITDFSNWLAYWSREFDTSELND